MIRINVLGLYGSDFSTSSDMRLGDAQIIDDGKNYLVIDGGCGGLATRLVKRLKALKIKTPYLLLTHPHYDHYYGLRKIINDDYFTPKMLFCQNPSTLRAGGNTDTLKTIISEAKAKGIPVKYLAHKEHVVLGELDFYVYRNQPEYAGNLDAYYNDGSLCAWFHEIGYWTSGDGPQEIYTMCKAVGAKPKLIKIPHHGNNCPRKQATGMKSLGTLYCWDNDYAKNITDFLQTGREDCLAVGMKYLSCHGDINMIFFRKRAVLYKGAQIFRYTCSYNGAPSLKDADLDIVKSVLGGKLGNGDARITALLDARYNPGIVQNEINALIALIK